MNENPYQSPATADLNAPTPEVRRSSWPVRWLKRNPFLTWFCIGLPLYACIWLVQPDYDDGLGGMLVLTEAVWGFPIWLSSELLFELHLARTVLHYELLSLAVGLAGCLVCDWIWRRVRWFLWDKRNAGGIAGTGDQP